LIREPAPLTEAADLALLYADAVRDLARHWPDSNGVCLGCEEWYPCPQEWITMRAISGIEARWRREARRFDAVRQNRIRPRAVRLAKGERRSA
jgi:hypothetical protein